MPITKKDCFAAKKNDKGRYACACLAVKNCDGCKFYKTKQQFQDDSDKADELRAEHIKDPVFKAYREKLVQKPQAE